MTQAWTGTRLSPSSFTRLAWSDPHGAAGLVAGAGAVLVSGLSLVDPERELVEFARELGDPVTYPGAEGSPVLHLTNSEQTPAAARNAAVEWHQDDIHTSTPASFTLLYGLEAPEPAPATMFANLASAYEALGTLRRRELDGLQVVHDPLGGAVRSRGESLGRSGHKGPRVTHPLVLTHPLTGRKQLFGVAGTAAGVVGLADAAAERLLRTLKRYVVQAPDTWSAAVQHKSLLVWDNIQVLHTATPVPYSDADGERRHVLRVSVVRR